MSAQATVFAQTFFHGTRADLKPGDLLRPGEPSNYDAHKRFSWVYCAATLDAAIWGAQLASGDDRERIYVVEAIGALVDDPNLTGKKFPGNPTLSFRSREPLRVLGEVVGWQGHSVEQVQQMKDGLARLRAEGADHIID